MKKVLFISLTLSDGGAERVVSVLSSRLAEWGFPVSVILYERREKEYPISEKLEIHVLPAVKGSNKFSRLWNRIHELKRLIRQQDPDVIIPFLAQPMMDAWLASRGTHADYVATVRNNPQMYPGNARLRRLVNLITRYADGIILQTEAQRCFFPQRTWKKCFVLPNPIEELMLQSECRYADDIHRIITCGRLNPQKNHRLLVDAFSIVVKEHPYLTLQIYGDGDESERLEQYIRERGLSESVRLMGRTERVNEVLMEGDLFVLSSDYEGMPNALMEAMTVGLPCISTNCPTGPADLIVHGENGLLVDCGNLDQLIIAMKYAVEHPEKMHEMGKKARELMRNSFTPDRIASRFMAHFIE